MRIGYYRMKKKYRIELDKDLRLIINFRSFEMRNKFLKLSKLYRWIGLSNKKQTSFHVLSRGLGTTIGILDVFKKFLWEEYLVIPTIDYHKIEGLFMMKELR